MSVDKDRVCVQCDRTCSQAEECEYGRCEDCWTASFVDDGHQRRVSLSPAEQEAADELIAIRMRSVKPPCFRSKA